MQTPYRASDYSALRRAARTRIALVSLALLAAWSAGLFARGYWTPDEPREADIAWRMSRQADKAVPLLAGEAFCEKPPFAYWVAGASIRAFGSGAWSARLPNLLYALIAALGVGLLARRSVGREAGLAAAAALATFLLSYQVLVWLATDAPLLAAVSVALYGAYAGFYAERSAERLRGYTVMHAALAVGFLSKSAAAWMVPALALPVLVLWERRWRELARWELYAGLIVQAALILAWVAAVYRGPDGLEHLKVFFWNNLAGRFAHVDAPQALQYASGHRNSPGKYLLELPMYLWPWTLLVAAALRRAWLALRAVPAVPGAGASAGASAGAGAGMPTELRPVRFALAAALPSLALLSVAATARNIYLAPALPGFALLLGWWTTLESRDRWDDWALRATAYLMLAAMLVFAVAGSVLFASSAPRGSLAIGALGLAAAALLAIRAESAARHEQTRRAQLALLLAYCVLLSVPAWPLYREVDSWQDLPSVARAIASDARGRPLILMAPDETTQAIIDMYVRTDTELVRGPLDTASLTALRERVAREPDALIVTLLPGRELVGAFLRYAERFNPGARALDDQLPRWIAASGLTVAHRYALPNGRRYALLEAAR
jgi:4-amino-4-deoxy-L-arabinose transferase-like glycosyltransferase